MISDDVKIFFDLLKQDDYCLLYNGNFVDAVTSKIINLTKVSLIQRGELIKIQNRFSYFITECFQNIIRHGGHKDHALDEKPLPGFFMTRIGNGQYRIVTGNLIDVDKIAPLKKQFDHVNSRSYDELKALYKKVMAEGKISEKGGAGLGLIDMARKSAQEIQYEFLNHTEKQSMFYNRIVMSHELKIEKRIISTTGIGFGINLHNEMVDRNVIILQKSDFTKDSALPLLEIVENNIVVGKMDASLVKETYKVLVELLQNISRFGMVNNERKESILLISKKDNHFKICSGNYIDNNRIKGFRKFIEKMSSMNYEELNKLYSNRLKSSNNSGIDNYTNTATKIDIGKILSERFSFKFQEVDGQATFFSVSASI